MTKQDLIDLGFVIEELDDDPNVYYMVYPLGAGLDLITVECSDEVENDNWSVAIGDVDDLYYDTKEQVKKIIDAIQKR